MPLILDVNDQPKTLEEAIDRIVDAMDIPESTYVRREGFAALHHGPGTAIRNGWNLWAARKDAPTVLHDHVMERFGRDWSRCPGDDICGLIYAGVEARLRGEAFDPQARVDETRAFYAR